VFDESKVGSLHPLYIGTNLILKKSGFGRISGVTPGNRSIWREFSVVRERIATKTQGFP
jgi:hypothetical protein